MTETKLYKSNMPQITLKLNKSNFVNAKIGSSIDAANIFRQLFEESIEIYESMFAIYLNRANKTIGFMRISQGGLSGTVIDQRLILKGAIESLASSFILCHNHPSGNKQPSDADINVTKRLKASADILDVSFLDHIVITAESYLSFADDGLL